MFGWLRRPRPMRVGVYIDAFNLYYGARDHCGRGTSGWRWLDLIRLSETLVAARPTWRGAKITRMVYCTALRTKDSDPTSAVDQATYLNALAQDPRFHVEYGQYNPKFGRGVLTRVAGSKRKHTRVVSPGTANFPAGMPFGEVRGPDGEMHISINFASYEEKGSDVNLASHLLIDLLNGDIDAALVISNDGDLRHPLNYARSRIPVGLVNPSRRPTSGMLKAKMGDGVGNHWWQRLDHSHFRNHQLPAGVQGIQKPSGW